jgi:DNA processing protein
VYESENYPRLLREISSPPSVLYIRGKLLPGDERAIAVVGTRHPTPHGKSATEKICEELVRYGFTIISGLAHGIDSIAHRSALQAGGRTIGVLGCGIDRVYPASNAWLFHEVMMKGCLISEFPLGTPPNAYNFPKRNRIISGMALGTIIAEAGEKSGALITANYALEQNRELFAIPGPIDSEKSAGVNRLIEEGAIPVTSARIVAETLLPSIEPLYPTPVEMAKPVQELKEETPEYKPSSAEQKLLAILSKEPVHIDTIAERLGIPIKDVLSLLFAFELKGVVKQFPGKYFIKV